MHFNSICTIFWFAYDWRTAIHFCNSCDSFYTQISSGKPISSKISLLSRPYLLCGRLFKWNAIDKCDQNYQKKKSPHQRENIANILHSQETFRAGSYEYIRFVRFRFVAFTCKRYVEFYITCDVNMIRRCHCDFSYFQFEILLLIKLLTIQYSSLARSISLLLVYVTVRVFMRVRWDLLKWIQWQYHQRSNFVSYPKNRYMNVWRYICVHFLCLSQVFMSQ